MKTMHKHAHVTSNSRIQCTAVSSSSSLILLFSPFTRIMSAWIPFGPAFQFPAATKTPQLLFWDATCPPQLRPGAIRKLLPDCCGDLRPVIKFKLFQQHRLAQGLQKICGSICSFRVKKAPAVFCQNQPVENTLGLQQVQVYIPSKTHPGQLQLIRQLHRSIQIWTRTTSNIDKKALKKNKKTFNHFSLRGTDRDLPALPSQNYAATASLESDCWSTCSVLSESSCQKDIETAISAGIHSI